MRVWAGADAPRRRCGHTHTHSHTHTHAESSQTKLETERFFSAVACISGLLLPFHSHVHCLINPSERSFVRTQHVIHANIMRELFTPCQWGLKYHCGAGDGRHLLGDDEKTNKKRNSPNTVPSDRSLAAQTAVAIHQELQVGSQNKQLLSQPVGSTT